MKSNGQVDAKSRGWRRAIYAAVIAYIMFGVAAYWRTDCGFTALIRFGQQRQSVQLPELQGMSLAIAPQAGYDGQFYAQLAVNPDLTSSEVLRTLDNPQYRARRILLPLLAHSLGFGRPWLTLQVYALINVAAWGALAWVLYRETRDQRVTGALVWATCLLNLGVLDSIRESLTDLPAVLLIATAVVLLAGHPQRIWTAALLLAAGGLVRETAVLAAGMLLPAKWRIAPAGPSKLLPVLLAGLPAALWMLCLKWLAVGGNAVGAENFGWPGVAFGRQFYESGAAILAGSRHWQFVFGPIAALGFAWQSGFVMCQALRSGSWWTRAALPFALLFWVLGDSEWGSRAGGGYWAVARVCLPMTMAYCLTIPRGRNFGWWLVLPNLCVVHAVIRFWPDFNF